MMIFIVIFLAFGLPLALYAPEPESLHAAGKTSLGRRIRSACGTFAVGGVLIAVAALSFEESYVTDPTLISWFALSRDGIFEQGRIFQFFTAVLLHINIFHLVANLSVLLLLSAYERRVGWHRFLAVFAVSAVLSSAGELLLLPPDVASMGASAGICGLATAYFLDYPDLTRSDAVKGLLLVFFIIGLYSIAWPVDKEIKITSTLTAHMSGACVAAAYVYFVPVQMACGKCSTTDGLSG